MSEQSKTTEWEECQNQYRMFELARHWTTERVRKLRLLKSTGFTQKPSPAFYEACDTYTSAMWAEKGWNESAIVAVHTLLAWIPADAFRCLFRNPFLPPLQVQFDENVRRIAERIYEKQSHDEEMLILGDAIEESFCYDDHLLTHCRRDRHWQGCWIIDAILGKE